MPDNKRENLFDSADYQELANKAPITTGATQLSGEETDALLTSLGAGVKPAAKEETDKNNEGQNAK